MIYSIEDFYVVLINTYLIPLPTLMHLMIRLSDGLNVAVDLFYSDLMFICHYYSASEDVA